MHPIRVAIADKQAVVRKSLRLLLKRFDCQIVAEGETGLAAIEIVDKHLPDVVIIDSMLPLIDGLEATRIISGKHPGPELLSTQRIQMMVSVSERLKPVHGMLSGREATLQDFSTLY